MISVIKYCLVAMVIAHLGTVLSCCAYQMTPTAALSLLFSITYYFIFNDVLNRSL